MKRAAWLVLLAGCESILGLGETKFTGGDAMQGDGGPDACGPSCEASFASCKQLKLMFPTAPSGVYTIDAGTGTFRAYCDQTGDSGGWTLALKVDGRLQTFTYDAAIWENNDLLGTATPDLDHTEAKLETWNALAFTQVRIGLEYPIDSGEVRYLSVPLAAQRMGELFIANQSRVTTLGRDAWKGLVGAAASLQPFCNTEGTNVFHDQTRVRLGIISNEQEDCSTPDSRIGVGGGGIVCGIDPTLSAGNSSCYGGDNGDVELASFAWVFVR